MSEEHQSRKSDKLKEFGEKTKKFFVTFGQKSAEISVDVYKKTVDLSMYTAEELGIILKVEDPMFRALYGDMRGFEDQLKKLKNSILKYLKGLDTTGIHVSAISNMFISDLIQESEEGTTTATSSSSNSNSISSSSSSSGETTASYGEMVSNDAVAYHQAVWGTYVGGIETSPREELNLSITNHVINHIGFTMGRISNIRGKLTELNAMNNSYKRREYKIEKLETRLKLDRKESDVTKKEEIEKSVSELRSSRSTMITSIFNELTLIRDEQPSILAAIFNNMKQCQHKYFINATDSFSKVTATTTGMIPLQSVVETKDENVVSSSNLVPIRTAEDKAVVAELTDKAHNVENII